MAVHSQRLPAVGLAGSTLNAQRPVGRRGNRGQSLIIVILILLAVAAMAALFVAMLISSQSRTARQADLASLKNIVEAGVRYADYQLTYSAEGADWRPLASSLTNPYPYEFGDGRFRLTLSYNPQANDPLSRFIKIECVASLRGNPFLKRSMVAYKPVLLADYLRFVTNRDHSSLPAVLGVPEVVQGAGTQGYETVLGVSAGRGNATFASPSPIVIGDATTQWLADIRPNDLIRFDYDGFWYVVATVDSNLKVTLTSNYAQTGGTGAYSIGRAPIRINSDVNWAGPVTAARGANEPMEVVGARGGWTPWHPTLNAYTIGSATFTTTSPTVSGSGTSWVTDGVLPGDWIRYDDADNVWYLIQTVVDDTTITLAENYAQTGGGPGNYTIRAGRNMYAANTRYQDPPAMNTSDPTTGQSRYLLLTRDSGAWLQDLGSNWYNTGWYGYGQGIYVDNFGDIQHAHNLAQLRNEWMNPAPNANFPTIPVGWDTAGWSYTPTGVQIILHPQGQYGITYPYLEMIRDDPDPNSGGYWRDTTGNWWAARTYPDGTTTLPANTQYFPYPINGVVYAEGNVRVSGCLPAATAPGLPRYYDSGINPNDPADDNRFYDLTIVSGGTTYIEGDIISPNTYITNYNAAFDPDSLLVNADQDTRVALLARDYVCLNMTAFGARLDTDPSNTTAVWNPTPVADSAGARWEMAPGSPAQKVTFNFRSYQPFVSAMLYIRHAGLLGVPAAWNNPDTGAPQPSLLEVTIGTTQFDWGATAPFQYHPTYTPAALNQSPRVTDAIAAADWWEVSVRTISGTGITTPIVAAAAGDPAVNNNVAIAGFQVLPSKINIDALIYAQEGSWFVLPGPWFNNNWNNPGNLIANDPVDDTALSPFNPYRWALGSLALVNPPYTDFQPRIFLNGAISENHTAALGDVHDWLSKWSGPDNAAIGQTPLLSYQFDAGLRATVYGDADGNSLPRLPKLPCPPGVIVWEEQ